MSAALVILPVVWATASQEEMAEPLGSAGATGRLIEQQEETEVEPAPAEMAFYRKYTEGMLRRYTTMSTESGRVPSILGREMFRGRVTNCTMHGFDDVVIFVHDVGRCLEMLTEGRRYLIRRIAMQEYTQGEIAAMTGIPLRTVHRRYARALDKLTEIFLERGLLEPRTACHEEGSVRY